MEAEENEDPEEDLMEETENLDTTMEDSTPSGKEETLLSQQASKQALQLSQASIPPRDEEAKATPLEGMRPDYNTPSIYFMCTSFIGLSSLVPPEKMTWNILKFMKSLSLLIV